MTRDAPDPSSDGSSIRSLDRTVHEPARLAILTVLDGTAKADFTFLLRVLGLTRGNLSSHLSKLEAAGLIAVSKSAGEIGPRTSAVITDEGRAAVRRHWNRLEELRNLGRGLDAD